LIYTGILFIVLMLLPTLLPIDLPQGWLGQLVS
jgi:putative tricarboxylic transport membrane protein